MTAWRQIQKRNFTNLDRLREYLLLPSEALASCPTFPLNLPVRLAEKIQKNTLTDPILRQFVPLVEEGLSHPGYVLDPVQDQTFCKTGKLLQKYRGRALLLTTSACAMHCRFCFRQNYPYETKVQGFDEELSLLRRDPSIEEVILSGGDPLSLSDATLAHLLQELGAIPHIQRLRFHTRFPIGIPERLDASFLQVLGAFPRQVVFVIHCNHPRELDQDVIAALSSVRKLGVLVLNQSVLLRGVNDDEETLLALSSALMNGGILPYYLHLLDPVSGAAHFSVPEERALQLVQFVREQTSGYGCPRLVREEAGMRSKTSIH